MRMLAIVLVVGAAALVGGVANASDSATKKSASDIEQQPTDIGSRGRHHHHHYRHHGHRHGYRNYGYRGYRPYYGGSYGYYSPRPYYGYGYGRPGISFSFGTGGYW